MDIRWEGRANYLGISPKRGAGIQRRKTRQTALLLFHMSLQGLMLSHACYVILLSPPATVRMLGVETLHKIFCPATQSLPAQAVPLLGTKVHGML